MKDITYTDFQISFSTADEEVDNFKFSSLHTVSFDVSNIFPHKTYRVVDGQIYPIYDAAHDFIDPKEVA